MNRLASFILIIAFLGQTFNQGVFYVGYLIDKREYVKNCVNKARPQMHCNGKCQLMKKIQEQAKKDQQQEPALKLAAKSEGVPSHSFAIILPAFPNAAHLLHNLPENAGSPVDQPSFVFHPPNC